MRKGQLKLIERATRYGIDAERVELLKNEGLTIKQLERIFYTLWECRNMSFDWIQAALTVRNEFVFSFIKEKRTEIPLSLLTDSLTETDIGAFFSSENFQCKSIFHVRLMNSLKEARYSKEIFDFVSYLHSKSCDYEPYNNWYCMKLRQCFRACNQTANPFLVKQLRLDIQAVNNLVISNAS